MQSNVGRQWIVAGGLLMSCLTAAADEFSWTMRWQRPGSGDPAALERVSRSETWPAENTAFIVCDVWDKHHCLNAVRRLEEFAPRLNAVLQVARRRGAVIIHSPSDCMPAYETHPARLRALNVPPAEKRPEDIQYWCSRIPTEERAAWPIDQSDGGEDDDPAEHARWAAELTALGRNPGMPWKTQSSLIEIDGERDYISDRGDEVWNILQARGIRHVVLTGVHTNMCVLGRPFGLRQMVRNGMNTVLMRDMTDCMYNPRRWPFVDHFTGNDLVISHVERWVCPTVTSDQLLGGVPFRWASDSREARDVMSVAAKPIDAAALSAQWTVVSLPTNWSDVTSGTLSQHQGDVWYRCTLRLSDRWLQEQEPVVLVQPPVKGKLSVWLNGQELRGVEPLCLACSAPEPIRFTLPLSGIERNDASLLVVRVRDEAAVKELLKPPVLKCGDRTYSLQGRWQIRAGQDTSWSAMPLPAKFGTATDVVFEPR